MATSLLELNKSNKRIYVLFWLKIQLTMSINESAGSCGCLCCHPVFYHNFYYNFFICFFLLSFLTFTNLFAIVKNTVSLNAYGTTRNDNRVVKYVFCFYFETNSFPFRTFTTDQFHSLQKNPSVQALAQFPLNSASFAQSPSHGRLTASLHSFLVNKKNNGSNSSTWKKSIYVGFLSESA